MRDPLWITRGEAARRLGLLHLADPARTVRELVRRGWLVGRKIAGVPVVDPLSVARYVTLAEAARLLGLLELADPERAVGSLIRAGELDGVTLAGRGYVVAASLERMAGRCAPGVVDTVPAKSGRR